MRPFGTHKGRPNTFNPRIGLSVSTDAGTVTAGPGAIVYMPKGEAVTIRSHEEGALTAYVTYPHWRPAHD